MVIFLKVHMHYVDKFQVVHPDLDVNGQKCGWHDIKKEFKNIAWKVHFWVTSMLPIGDPSFNLCAED